MDIQFGNVEAIAQAASYSDNAAAVLDLDTGGGYAQVGAKGGVGTSLGAKIRTVLNGVMKDAIAVSANGLVITLLTGSTLVAQAVTGTTATFTSGTFTAGINSAAVTASGIIVGAAGIIGRLDASGISYGLQVLNVGGASQIGALGFSVSSGAENSGNPVYKAAIGIQRSDVNGFGDLLFMVRNSNDTGSASLADLKMRLSAAGLLTISGGLNISGSGMTVTGLSTLQAITIGGGGTINKLLTGSLVWDPPSLANGASASTTMTVTGATVGLSTVTVGTNVGLPAGFLLTGVVTAADTVTITLFNATGGTVDVGNATWRADVWLH